MNENDTKCSLSMILFRLFKNAIQDNKIVKLLIQYIHLLIVKWDMNY